MERKEKWKEKAERKVERPWLVSSEPAAVSDAKSVTVAAVSGVESATAAAVSGPQRATAARRRVKNLRPLYICIIIA